MFARSYKGTQLLTPTSAPCLPRDPRHLGSGSSVERIGGREGSITNEDTAGHHAKHMTPLDSHKILYTKILCILLTPRTEASRS